MSNSNSSLFLGIGDEVILGFCLLLTIIYFLYQFIPQIFTGQEQIISNEELNSGRVRSTVHDCSICLSEASYAIQTNCGHIYCAQCIIAYYENVTTSSVTTALSKYHKIQVTFWARKFVSKLPDCRIFLKIKLSKVNLISGPFDTPTCPYCRQRMTMLLLYFSESERGSADPAEIDQRNRLIQEIRNYNSRYSGEPRSFSEQLRDLPVLLRHLWSFIWSPDGLSWLFRLRIFTLGGMAGLYLLSPFDIVPEAAFGIIGIFDDLVIVALFLLYASMLYRNFITDNQ